MGPHTFSLTTPLARSYAAPHLDRFPDAERVPCCRAMSWQLAAGSPVSRIVDFAIDPNDGNRVFVAAINDGLFVSTDAGAALSRLTTFQLNHGPSNGEMSRDGTLYATADTRIYRKRSG
jgi:hypothetical protein